MNQIFFKTAIRNLLKDKTYSIINILGLAIGMACVILIYLWINDEVGYNRFHKNVDQLYMVQQNWKMQEGSTVRGTYTPYSIADAFREEIPEVEMATQFGHAGRLKIKYQDKIHFNTDAMCVSDEFLTMFSFELSKGNAITALSEPYSIVLTKELASTYFGNEDPIDKIIEVNEEYSFRVTGVLDEMPQNSTLEFTCLLPISYCKTIGDWYDNWDSNSLYTYLMLNKKADLKQVDEKMTQMLRSHLRAEYGSDPTNNIGRAGYALAPLRDIHLYRWGDGNTGLSNIHYVYIFAAIALFILMVASINFMNLSIARSLKSAKVIGVKKVSGAHRKHLVSQFLGESFMFSMLAAGVSFIIVVLLLPQFNNVTGKKLSLDIFTEPEFILVSVSIIILTSVLSGGYPAVFLSSFKPIKVLKGNKLTDNSGIIFRKGLVVFQFAISILLIVGTLLVIKQLNFMQNKNLGMEKDHLIYLNIRGTVSKYYEPLKEELLKYPGINNISSSGELPADINNNTGDYSWQGKDPERQYLIKYQNVNYDYFKTTGIEFVEGRPFSKYIGTDRSQGFIINEKAMHTMGFESAVDLPVNFWGIQGKIIGVVKDFHFKAMDKPIEPLIILLRPQIMGRMLINISNNNMPQTLDHIRKTWDKVAEGNPIAMRFLDERIQEYYEKDIRTGNLLKIFAALSICIACLGLFGLSSFMIENRNKEIGVRKVNGARIVEIVKLLNSDFTIWIFVSFVIATPLSYLAVQKWLTNFAYKTEISWWIFAAAGSFALLITFLTVSWQCWRAARRNPVEALRYE